MKRKIYSRQPRKKYHKPIINYDKRLDEKILVLKEHIDNNKGLQDIISIKKENEESSKKIISLLDSARIEELVRTQIKNEFEERDINTQIARGLWITLLFFVSIIFFVLFFYFMVHMVEEKSIFTIYNIITLIIFLLISVSYFYMAIRSCKRKSNSLFGKILLLIVSIASIIQILEFLSKMFWL